MKRPFFLGERKKLSNFAASIILQVLQKKGKEMRRIYLLLSSVMLLSLTCLADPISVPIKPRPPLINTHGASRAPSLNQELRVMYDDDNSVLIFYCENAVHPFSYVISKGLCN